MRFLLPFGVVLSACESGYAVHPQQRTLDSFPYVDCGVVVPEDREICTVPLFSEADGKVQIFDIQTTDLDVPEGGAGAEGSFIVTPTEWQSADCGDGDCRYLEGYDDHSDEDTLALGVVFAPLVEGFYRAELTIWSNDSESTETLPLPSDPSVEKAIWKVQLRGLSRKACGSISPIFVDFGARNSGGEFTTATRVSNCGIVTLEVGGSQEAGTGAEEMEASTDFPLYALPGQYEDVGFSWLVGAETNGEPTAVEDVVWFSSNSEVLDDQTFTMVGNDCSKSVDDSWDADSDGWFSCGGDCNDLDSDVNPSKPERSGNGDDDDCDGEIDEGANPVGSDDDGDGWTETEGDCDDASMATSPQATETINQVDDDCNGYVDDNTERFDDDGDGYAEREGDCDDTDATVSPSSDESTNDGQDNDCDGITDEGGQAWDDDEDGWLDSEADSSMNDCDDQDTWVYVGAFEFCDGYDNDCDGVPDEDEDDVAEGACSFLPDRRGDADGDSGAAGSDGGCSTVPGVPWALGVGLAGLAAALRARRF